MDAQSSSASPPSRVSTADPAPAGTEDIFGDKRTSPSETSEFGSRSLTQYIVRVRPNGTYDMSQKHTTPRYRRTWMGRGMAGDDEEQIARNVLSVAIKSGKAALCEGDVDEVAAYVSRPRLSESADLGAPRWIPFVHHEQFLAWDNTCELRGDQLRLRVDMPGRIPASAVRIYPFARVKSHEVGLFAPQSIRLAYSSAVDPAKTGVAIAHFRENEQIYVIDIESFEMDGARVPFADVVLPISFSCEGKLVR